MKSEIKKPLTKEQIEELADKIYKLFRKHEMWADTAIYFNGQCINNKDDNGKYHYDGTAYHHADRNPRDYFEYVNPDHILSMSFEGPVYHMLNYGEYPSVHRKFKDLLTKYGLYFELGNAWNLSCYYL